MGKEKYNPQGTQSSKQKIQKNFKTNRKKPKQQVKQSNCEEGHITFCVHSSALCLLRTDVCCREGEGAGAGVLSSAHI